MKARRWLIFANCAPLLVMSMFFRASSAVIAPDLIRDLELGLDDLGLLGAVFFYAFALVQIPLGLTLDRIGARRTMVGLNLIGGLGAQVFAQADCLASAVAGLALLGLGMSANLMGPLWLYTRWFRANEFATMFGLTMAAGSLGSILATSPLALLVHSLGWRLSFQLLGGLSAALGLSLWLIVRDRPAGPPAAGPAAPRRSAWASLKLLAGSRSYWVISGTTFLRYGTYAGIQALWAGPFLMNQLGLSQVEAGHFLLLLNLGFITGGPAAGLVSDRLLGSAKRTVQMGLIAAAATLLCLAFWPGWVAFLVLGPVMFGLGLFNAFANVTFAHIKELMPADMPGTAMAGINLFGMLGGGVFIQGLGGVLERLTADPAEGGFRTAFLICCGAIVLARLIYSASREASPGA